MIKKIECFDEYNVYEGKRFTKVINLRAEII